MNVKLYLHGLPPAEEINVAIARECLVMLWCFRRDPPLGPCWRKLSCLTLSWWFVKPCSVYFTYVFYYYAIYHIQMAQGMN